MRHLDPGTVQRQWSAFGRLRAALFNDGGVTIDTPPLPGEEGPYRLRTVIQADGDVLWLVRRDLVRQAPILQAHVALVATWYDEASSTVRGLRRYLTVLQAAIGATVGCGWLAGFVASLAVQGWSLRLWVWRAMSLLVPLLVPPVAKVLVVRRLRQGLPEGLR